MSLTNINASNTKSMLINSGRFRSGVYITSHNQFLIYTDENNINTAYYFDGILPYTTTSSSPYDDINWKKLFISDKNSFLKTDIVPIINGGTGANTQSTARANLGLGSSSTYNIGVSGTTIPLLSTANTWSSNQWIRGTLTLGNSGSTSILNIGGLCKIRENGFSSTIISVNNSTPVTGNNGLFLRPNGDTDSTVQLLGNNDGWVFTGNVSCNGQTFAASGTTSLSGTVNFVSDTYTIDTSGFYSKSTGKNLGVVGTPWNTIFGNSITSGTGSSLILNSTSGTTTIQNNGSSSFSFTGTSFLPTSGKTSGVVGTPWATTYCNTIHSGTGTSLTLNGTANNVNLQIASSTIVQLSSTGLLINNNISYKGKNTSGTAMDLCKIDSTNTIQISNINSQTNINSVSNPTTTIGSNKYTLYHTGNVPTQDIFRATYMATSTDIKQTISEANTPQVLLPNTVSQTSSYFTIDMDTGIITSSDPKNISLNVSAEVIREISSTTMVYWMMFVESSTDGSSWTTVTGSEKIVTLSPSLTNEIVNVNMTIAMATTSGMKFRIKQASTSSTSGISVISKYALFSGAPISSGFTISISTI